MSSRYSQPLPIHPTILHLVATLSIIHGDDQPHCVYEDAEEQVEPRSMQGKLLEDIQY